jgi:N-acetylmuramoyl-L-alanine amidase
VRVSLSLTADLQTNVFKLKKFQDKPDRIVIDISLQDSPKQDSDAREPEVPLRRSRIVVIDPGHGGDAPGAVGKKGTHEKIVVLAIAKKIRDILNNIAGYKAILTRDSDYYVSFKKRLRVARESGADLFISIHADAARNRGASGSSVYCLSIGGASSEAARILANDENLADIVGGVPSSEGSDASDPIILDMFQTHTINQSRSFGLLLLKELNAANHLKFTTVQEAPFIVLKLPEIPSVLVETAYISNEKEENLLRSTRFQGRVAEGIVRSIVEFFPPLTPVLAEASAKEKGGKRTSDSPVEAVAAERKKPPAIESARRVKEKAVVERKRTALSKPHPPASYRVKKGDTLAAIAAKHGTTVRFLIDLNHLKRPYKLHVGRKLLLQ